MDRGIPRQQLVSKTKAAKELFRVARYGDASTVRLVARTVNDVDTRANQDGFDNMTPLMHASMACIGKNVVALIQAGARVECVDKNGRSALYYVCMGRHDPETIPRKVAMIHLLKYHGIDANHRDNFGKTVFDTVRDELDGNADLLAALAAPVTRGPYATTTVLAPGSAARGAGGSASAAPAPGNG